MRIRVLLLAACCGLLFAGAHAQAARHWDGAKGEDGARGVELVHMAAAQGRGERATPFEQAPGAIRPQRAGPRSGRALCFDRADRLR